MTVDRVALLREDVQAGPAALAALLDAYAAPDGPLAGIGQAPAEIVFSGLGSSRYAALTGAAEARRRGIPAWAEVASTSAATPSGPDRVLLVISASGGTRETVAAAGRFRASGGRVIVLTNVPSSPLAAAADYVLPLLAGREDAGIATRTFRATVAVLAMLVGHWSGDEALSPTRLRATVEGLESLLASRDRWVGAAADLLDAAPAIDVIGDDADAGLVQQAALMLREAPRLPAVAHDTADWLHTAVYLALPGHRAILFAGSAADAEVVETIGRRDGEVVVVGLTVPGAAMTIDEPAPPGGPFERAIVSSVVAELVAAELWARTSAAERERD